MLAEIVFLPEHVLPAGIGLLFGMSLYLSGLAMPDKILGTLRLKDFHAMRVIAVFLIIGMLGTWALSLADEANYDVKTAQLLVNGLGGMLLGIGFGLTGFCPGTGLAAAATGRIDALFTVIGMFGGALAYIYGYPYVVEPMQKVWDYGKVRIPEITGTVHGSWLAIYWVLPICGLGLIVLWLTRPRPHRTRRDAEPTHEAEMTPPQEREPTV